jgi:Flp pilus assembly pilin Flp
VLGTVQGLKPDVYPNKKAPADPRLKGGFSVAKWLNNIWHSDQGQDVAEYAVMLAVILVIVVGTIRLIGSNANNVFSSVGSAIQ